MVRVFLKGPKSFQDPGMTDSRKKNIVREKLFLEDETKIYYLQKSCVFPITVIVTNSSLFQHYCHPDDHT